MNLRYGYVLHNIYFWPPTAAKYAAYSRLALTYDTAGGYVAPHEYSWNYNRLVECV